MYCNACGIELSDNFRYCPQCGTTTHKDGFTSATGKPARFLSRPRDDRKIAGVCSGIARYLGVDVTLVRIIMVVLAIWPPSVGLIVYIVCWIVMPQEPLLLPPASQPVSPQPSGAA
ncbi:MAG TPA: PspC domain-containing protein [Bryobacteraceae bacterium]|jgi:phage shock protein C